MALSKLKVDVKMGNDEMTSLNVKASSSVKAMLQEALETVEAKKDEFGLETFVLKCSIEVENHTGNAHPLPQDWMPKELVLRTIPVALNDRKKPKSVDFQFSRDWTCAMFKEEAVKALTNCGRASFRKDTYNDITVEVLCKFDTDDGTRGWEDRTLTLTNDKMRLKFYTFIKQGFYSPQSVVITIPSDKAFSSDESDDADEGDDTDDGSEGDDQEESDDQDEGDENDFSFPDWLDEICDTEPMNLPEGYLNDASSFDEASFSVSIKQFQGKVICVLHNIRSDMTVGELKQKIIFNVEAKIAKLPEQARKVAMASTFGVDGFYLKDLLTGTVLKSNDVMFDFLGSGSSRLDLLFTLRVRGAGRSVKKDSKVVKAQKAVELKSLLEKKTGAGAHVDDVSHNQLNQHIQNFVIASDSNPLNAMKVQIGLLPLPEIEAILETLEKKKDGGNSDAKLQSISTSFFGTNATTLLRRKNAYEETLDGLSLLLKFCFNKVGETQKFQMPDLVALLEAEKNKKIGAQSAGSTGYAPMAEG